MPTTTDRSAETARLAVCGAAVTLIKTLDAHAPAPELGYRIERLRSRVLDYLAAVRPGDDTP
jgi:hypothetical protein